MKSSLSSLSRWIHFLNNKYTQLSMPYLVFSCLLFASIGEGVGLGLVQIPILLSFSLLILAILFSLKSVTQVLRSKLGFTFTVVNYLLLIFLSFRVLLPALLGLTRVQKYEVWDRDLVTFAAIANSISSANGVANNLGLEGDPIRYHTAPSFVAASIADIGLLDSYHSGLLVEVIFSFALIVLSLKLASIWFANFDYRYTATLATLNLPFFTFKDDFRVFAFDIFNHPSFSFDMMLGSLLGTTLLCAILSLPSYRLSIELVIPAVSTLALFEIKPQYIPLLPLVCSLRLFRASGLNIKSLLYVFVITFMCPVIFFAFEKGNLGISTSFSFQLPTNLFPDYFIRLVNLTPVITSTLFLVIIFAIRLAFTGVSAVRVEYLWLLLPSVVLVVSRFIIDTLRLRINTPPDLDWLDLSSLEKNDDQMIYPLSFFSLLIFLVAVVNYSKVGRVLITYGVVLSTIISSFVVASSYLGDNSKTEDYADLTSLSAVYRSISKEGLILTNDFSFPANNYMSPNNGDFLTIFSKNSFYLAMPANIHQSPLLTERLANTQRFFGSEFSKEHFDFIVENGIRYLLINRRCETPFVHSEGILNVRIYINKDYELYDINLLDREMISALQESSPLVGQYKVRGFAECQQDLVWINDNAKNFS